MAAAANHQIPDNITSGCHVLVELDRDSNVESCTMSNGTESNDFNLATLKSEFEKCVSNSGAILIEHYILGYAELDKFLHLLGTVFGQVRKKQNY